MPKMPANVAVGGAAGGAAASSSTAPPAPRAPRPPRTRALPTRARRRLHPVLAGERTAGRPRGGRPAPSCRTAASLQAWRSAPTPDCRRASRWRRTPPRSSSSSRSACSRTGAGSAPPDTPAMRCRSSAAGSRRRSPAGSTPGPAPGACRDLGGRRPGGRARASARARAPLGGSEAAFLAVSLVDDRPLVSGFRAALSCGSARRARS